MVTSHKRLDFNREQIEQKGESVGGAPRGLFVKPRGMGCTWMPYLLWGKIHSPQRCLKHYFSLLAFNLILAPCEIDFISVLDIDFNFILASY